MSFCVTVISIARSVSILANSRSVQYHRFVDFIPLQSVVSVSYGKFHRHVIRPNRPADLAVGPFRAFDLARLRVA